MVELLHLLLCEDGVPEVGLELLQGQLPVVWERRSGQRDGNNGRWRLWTHNFLFNPSSLVNIVVATLVNPQPKGSVFDPYLYLKLNLPRPVDVCKQEV